MGMLQAAFPGRRWTLRHVYPAGQEKSYFLHNNPNHNKSWKLLDILLNLRHTGKRDPLRSAERGIGVTNSIGTARTLVAFISALFVGAAALAQAPPTKGSQPEGELQEIVVTAQKRAENINNVPLSIATASGDELRERGIYDPTQLEVLAPGFSYQKSSYGVPVFSLRGVGFYDTTQGVTPAVAVYVDQIPLPYSAMTRGAGLDVERVEVLKGPQGTLFGQNSTGGAVNYIAAKPLDTLAYGTTVDYGRFNALNFEGYLTGPLTSTLRARLAVRVEHQDDWQYSYTRSASLGRKEYHAARLLLDWDPTSALSFELGFTAWRDGSDTQAPQARQLAFQSIDPRAANPVAIAALTNYPLAPADARAADWDPGRNYAQNNRFTQTTLHGEWLAADRITVTSLTAYSRYHTFSLTDGDGTDYTSLTPVPDALLTSLSQELRLAGDLNDKRIQWMLGGNYNYSKAFEDQFTYTGGTSHILLGHPFLSTILHNHQRVDTRAAFASLNVSLSDQFTIQGSARYTTEERKFEGCISDSGDGTLATTFATLATILSGSPKTLLPGQCITLDANFQSVLVHKTLDENNVSWRGSLNWKPNDDTLLYISSTKGYKAGNFSTIPGLTPEQFDPLRQESVLSYETGFKTTLMGHTLQLNGAMFYYDYRDKQLLGSIQNPVFGTLPGSVAIPKSRILGWESDLTWRPAESFRMTAAVSYVDSKIKSDPPLPIDPYGKLTTFVGESFPYTPKWQASTDAEYRFPVSSLGGFVGATVTYRSSTYSNFGENALFLLNERTLVDLRAGLRGAHWRAELYGRNVTNELYYIQTSRLTDTVVSFTGMPTTYGVQVSYQY